MRDKNLIFKNIREFTPEDTIYLQEKSGASRNLILCQFVRFEKGKVTAVPVEKKYGETQDAVTNALEKCALYGVSENGSRTGYHWFDPIGCAAYESPEIRHLAVPTHHPSYAMIAVNKRTSSGNVALFGSSILHCSTISLKISPAELNRSLHEDRIFAAGRSHIEVEMSSQQFADMLTSPNTQGTPVTLRRLGNEDMEACPFISKIEQFDMELEGKIKEIHEDTKQKMANLQHIIENSKLPAKDKEYITKAISSISTGIECNLPFLQSQVAEGMSKVVGEAKAAITSYLQQEAKNLGIPVKDNLIGIE